MVAAIEDRAYQRQLKIYQIVIKQSQDLHAFSTISGSGGCYKMKKGLIMFANLSCGEKRTFGSGNDMTAPLYSFSTEA